MKPSTFAMTLRKHITNGRIIGIQQHEFDRIIKITIQKKDQYILLFELIPNGNMILLNQEHRIIMPLKHQHWSHRTIRINTTYQPPPSQVNPFTITEEEIELILKDSDADLIRTLAVKVSLGGRYAEELCKQVEIPKEIPTKNLSNVQQKKIYDQLQKFLVPFKEHNFSPTLIIHREDKKEVIPLPFTMYKEKDKKPVKSFSEGLQQITEINITQIDESSPYEKRREKLVRQKKQQEKAILEFDEEIKKKKHQGNVIYLHYTFINQLTSEIQKNRKLLTKEELSTLVNNTKMVKEFSNDSPFLTLELPDEHQQPTPILIDYRKNTAENAERLYEKSKKMMRKKQGAINALKQTEQKINELEKQHEKHVDQEKKQVQHKQSLQKQFWFEQYRWCIASNGNIILGGKDAKTNDQLIKKQLENGDRYAHADIHGAPSCIVKNTDIEGNIIPITEETLKELCTFSACYSKAWKQFVEAQAYWVLPEQVSKTPQSGEFVPKGGFIIRGKRNYSTCALQLGIGCIYIDQIKKIMGGPSSAIKKWCDTYVIIEPGTKKSSTIAKEIAEILDSSPSMIQQVLPPGEINIISTSKKAKKKYP
ncbi:MAG: ribosome rescue protein RqcH [Candidatus Thermoplasmatota archaeon]|nr:ribosome rescue protein RqcH [Candidatus Thermoplasmatota archaeon]